MAKVFAVDTDPSVLRVIEFSLRIEGFEVATFPSPLNALSALAEGDHPDALFMDLNMPVMDGREFYRQVRQIGFENPVLVLSASYPGPVVRELGANDWLAKPFAPAVLAKKVNRLSNGHSNEA